MENNINEEDYESNTRAYSQLFKIVKHNNFIQGKYHLDASEQKLLYKIFEEVQKKGYTTRTITISFQDFYHDYKDILHKNISKKDFKKLIEGLQVKMPYIIKDNTFVRTQWYKIEGKIDYSEVKLIIDEDIFDCIQSMKENFTSLRLETIYSFKSFYAMRIYELIKQWSKNRRFIRYKLSLLRELLQIEGKYETYGEFNRNVLKKAVNEINSKSELKIIEYKGIRKGSPVDVIQFEVEDKEINDKEKLKIDKDTIEINTVFKSKKAKNNNEDVEDKNDNEDIKDNKNKEIVSNDEFFIPEELSLDSKVKNLFKMSFARYDFSNVDYYLMVLEAETLTLEKDKSEKITPLNYRLFTNILEKKIKKYEENISTSMEASISNNIQTTTKLSEKDKKKAEEMGISEENYLKYLKHLEQ